MDQARSENPDILLARVALGDADAFARLYALTSPRMLGLALRLMRERDRAEDVVQDTFVTVWRKAAQYRPERGAALAWMTTILRHRALDLLRQAAARPTDGLDLAGEIAVPALAGRVMDLRTLQACLEELDAQQQRCIQMAFLDGYTHEELALRLDAPIGTVKSWIRRGLTRLKGCLER
ncbi:MAG: sigma-70 family RNA polymerase sigma factor [Alphaproteobacteria bacterium]|nr:sigma-70 family RNA polymerase sigma factor [Alphaproteobacteria bacterium]